MARTVRDAKLDTRSARVKLAPRREPYWRPISKGCALGYRKGSTGGTWIARFRDDSGKQRYQSLAAADDAMDADGIVCLSYAEAQREAGEWFKVAASGFSSETPRSGPYTLKDALSDYMASYKRNGGKSIDRTQSVIDAHIVSTMGGLPVSKLTKRKIENWLDNLADAAPMIRSGYGKPQQHRELDDSPEGKRRRKSSANRVLTVLKAALNNAFSEGKIASDNAWRQVKPFREADSARIRYLKDDESRRLVNACTPEFRPLVQAALLTGCRYGELAALTIPDFNPDAGTVHIRISKSGKPRHVVLTDEGRDFFTATTIGKTGHSLILTRSNGDPWGRSHQQRPYKAACEKANVDALTFHELRHTYASRLVMSGAPLAVVAAQLGHSDTRMVEKHYGHMSPNYVADTVRANFSSLGIVQTENVTPIRNGGV
jgi:integrase